MMNLVCPAKGDDRPKHLVKQQSNWEGQEVILRSDLSEDLVSWS